VVGVERGGTAKAKRGRSHAERTIAAFVYRHVDRSSALFTDDLPAYRWIGSKFPVQLSVNHTRGEFARRDPLAIATAHVNPAESFNAILKRAWVGVWHWFSPSSSNSGADGRRYRIIPDCERPQQTLGDRQAGGPKAEYVFVASSGVVAELRTSARAPYLDFETNLHALSGCNPEIPIRGRKFGIEVHLGEQPFSAKPPCPVPCRWGSPSLV
jgi:hypothetical protein